MYKLFNWLFGWDYIHWQNYCDASISRVRIDGNGNSYFFRYGKYITYLDKPSERITWLTCNQYKYLKLKVTNLTNEH